GEVVVGPVAAAEADQAEAGRQQTAVGEVVDRRQQLLAREVAGDAEHHHRAGPCDERHATVARVAQRIGRIRPGEEGGGVGHDRPFSDSGTGARPAALAGPCSWRGQAREDSTDSETVASSSFQDFSNFSTPSRSSTANTSARSTPAAETRSSTAWAEAAVCAFSAACGSECSATAARVFSGMVLPVGSATRLSTERVSEYSGCFTPVEAHRARCAFAPFSLSASKRSPEKAARHTPKATCALATPAWPRSAAASSVPSSSSRESISESTRETKKEATDWMLERSLPAAAACSRPARYASITAR